MKANDRSTVSAMVPRMTQTVSARMVFSGDAVKCLRGGREIFSDLDFNVASGELLTLTGPNGSGKTSLLRLMAGIGFPHAGKISWNGQNILNEPQNHSARIRYVGHQDAVKPILTVNENLSFWYQYWKVHDQKRTIEETLDVFDLTKLADVPGRLLSAGQRKKVSLARLVLGSAPIWLLDEPTSSLDDKSTKTLFDVVANHVAGNGLVVIATHQTLPLLGNSEVNLGTYASVTGTVFL